MTVILLFSVDAIRGNGPVWQILQLRDVPGSPFETSLTRGRLALIQAIADDKSYIIDKYARGAFPDVLYADGHYYSVFVPGAAFIAVPLYMIGKQYNLGVLSAFLLGPIFTFLVALCTYNTLRIIGFQRSVSLLSTFVILFGTSIYPYTGILNAHPVSAFSISLAMLGASLVFMQKRHAIGNILFWFAFGLGLITDYPNGISLVPLGVALFFFSFRVVSMEARKVLSVNLSFFLAILFACVGIIPLLLYTHALFGTYLSTVETHQIQGYVDEKGAKVYTLSDDPMFYLTHKVLHNPLKLDPHFTIKGVYTLLFSPERGLFFYSPILLLFYFGISTLAKKSPYLAYGAFSSVVITILTYGSYSDYGGGWSFGTRFLVGVMPFMALFLAAAIERYNTAFFSALFGTLGTISIAINTLGALTSRVNPSPLEKEYFNCNLACSFLRELPLIQHGKYMSFAYTEYFQSMMNRQLFFALLLGSLLVVFYILIITSKLELRHR